MNNIWQLFKINKHAKISYSQCGEDLIIDFIFKALNINTPSFIDIGAHDPFYLNNTALFYKKGSTGINIDADPKSIEKFRKYRKKDINLNIGISDKEGHLNFYILSTPTLNTFSLKEATELKNKYGYRITDEIEIKTQKLSKIIAEYCEGIFPDYLTIDVEGNEMDILRDIEICTYYPKVVCCETISYSENGNGIKNHKLIEYLENNGYFVYADTYINTIFVREQLWRNR